MIPLPRVTAKHEIEEEEDFIAIRNSKVTYKKVPYHFFLQFLNQ